MMDWADITLRLCAATLIGSVIGLNRDLHGKPTGVRTLGIVGLGSALAVMASLDWAGSQSSDVNAISRVIQGIVTGIGFLGAGVIVRSRGHPEIRGLTTAACTWLTACLGIICGIAAWRLVVIALPLIFIVLIVGGPIEQWLHARWGRADDD